MKANYVGFSDGAESMAYLDQERGVIKQANTHTIQCMGQDISLNSERKNP